MNARISLIATIVMTAAIVGCNRSSNDSEIRIGVLAPLTGVMGGHGESIVMGARVAEEELNARGGILGRPVKIVVLDEKSDPAVTAERARELAATKHVHLAIGTGFSSCTLAALGPLSDANIPFIYSLDGECKTCKPKSATNTSELVWGSGFTERMMVRPFLQELLRRVSPTNEAPAVYFIGGDYVYPRSTIGFAKKIAEELGFRVVGEDYTDTSASDYGTLIRKISTSHAQLLIVVNPGSSGVTFMKQALQRGLDKETLISGFATFDQEAIEAMGESSEGVVCVNRYSNTLDNEQNVAFVRRFRRLYPRATLLPGPTAAAGSYGSLMVAAAAYEKAGTTNVMEFRKAMSGLQVRLPQGLVTVNPTNNIFDQPLYLMQIRKQTYTVLTNLGVQSHPGLEGCSVQ